MPNTDVSSRPNNVYGRERASGHWSEQMTTGPPQSETAASLDALLSAVAHERRRAVLNVLNGADEETIAFDTLTERVAELDSDGDEESDDGHRQRVRTTLHHSHLPKLVACGLVAYDTDAMTVRKVDSRWKRQLRTVLESHERGE